MHISSTCPQSARRPTLLRRNGWSSKSVELELPPSSCSNCIVPYAQIRPALFFSVDISWSMRRRIFVIDCLTMMRPLPPTCNCTACSGIVRQLYPCFLRSRARCSSALCPPDLPRVPFSVFLEFTVDGFLIPFLSGMTLGVLPSFWDNPRVYRWASDDVHVCLLWQLGFPLVSLFRLPSDHHYIHRSSQKQLLRIAVEFATYCVPYLLDVDRAPQAARTIGRYPYKRSGKALLCILCYT